MTDIKRVGPIELARPRGNFHGKIATGYYTVADDTVMLVHENGAPVDRYELTRKLKPGEDAHNVACALMRQRYSKSGDGSFNRPLHYPPLRF